MNPFKKSLKPPCIFLAVALLLVSNTYQSASAAMIGTEKLLQAGSHQAPRDYLSQLMACEDVKSALIAQGVDPQEAQLRLQSLTDDEIELIAANLEGLAAGKGVIIFSAIVVGVIIATVLLFHFTSITDVFP
jgi:phosphoribosylamine-glycine ligase